MDTAAAGAVMWWVVRGQLRAKVENVLPTAVASFALSRAATNQAWV